MDSYANAPSWHRYRQLLLDTFGIPIRHVPIERCETVLGHDVHLDEWHSEGRSRGTLILVHGGGGNGRILAPLADFAAGLGWRSPPTCRATVLPARVPTSAGTTASGLRWSLPWPTTARAPSS
jgi:hypothetical protein